MDELDAFLDRLTARLSSVSGTLTAQTLRRIVLEAQGWHYPNDPKLAAGSPGVPCGGMTVNYVDSSATHWSPWLEWRGGPCPLPPESRIDVEFRNGHRPPSDGSEAMLRWTNLGFSADVVRFRYHADNPAGWLPRGDWIPPAELWAPECPVRVEWTRGMAMADYPGTYRTDDWCHGTDPVTHIRLRPRHPKAELPEGFSVDKRGSLVAPCGRVALARVELDLHGPAAIRQAVDAWLREMGDE